MDTLYRQIPRSACSLFAERKVYQFNGDSLGSYLGVTTHTVVPVGLYPLEWRGVEGEPARLYERSRELRKQAVSYQFKTYKGRVIHFPLDHRVQMQAFFHALSPDPIDVLECHPDGNRSYSSYCAVLDAGCRIEHLYRRLCCLREQTGERFTPAFQQSLYRLLWEVYFLEYPDLLRVAAEYDGFRDRGAGGLIRTYRPQSTYQDPRQDSSIASRAIAHAVWQYQHCAIWSIPPVLRAVAQRYWRETHDEPFPSDQFRQQILQPGEVVVLAPDREAE